MTRETDLVEHTPEEMGELFSAHDGGSTEREYLEFLHSLVRITKPKRVLETGCMKGYGTYSLAAAVQANGFGSVVTLETSRQHVDETRKHLEEAWLDDLVTIVEAESLEWFSATTEQFDLAFFDSDLNIRGKEFEMCLDRGILKSGSWAAFHDSARTRLWGGKRDPASVKFWEDMDRIMKSKNITQHIEFPLSRGLLVLRVP